MANGVLKENKGICVPCLRGKGGLEQESGLRSTGGMNGGRWGGELAVFKPDGRFHSRSRRGPVRNGGLERGGRPDK